MVQQELPWLGKRGLRKGIAIQDAEIRRLELETMARELRAGSLALAAGRVSVELSPAVMLDVEIKATKRPDREGIDVRLSWRPPQPSESGARGEF